VTRREEEDGGDGAGGQEALALAKEQEGWSCCLRCS